MPRTARASRGGVCHHVMTRGNRRDTVFHDARDYATFLALMRRANERLPVRILGFCLMPNHVHLVLLPAGDGELGRWMHWLLTAHVQRYRKRYDSSGRIWQGRFKAPPVQQDRHLLTVLRYVERNPLRSGLVNRAEAWPWSSLRLRKDRADPLLSPPPIPLPQNWAGLVDEPLATSELAAIREGVQRERPFGDAAWVRGAAEQLGLLSTLRARGRPPAFSVEDPPGLE